MASVEEDLRESMLFFTEQLARDEFKDNNNELLRRFIYTAERCDLHSAEMVSEFFRRCVGICIKEVGQLQRHSTMLNIRLVPPKLELVCANITRILDTITMAIDSPHVALMHYRNDLRNAVANAAIIITHNRYVAKKYYL